MCLVMWSACCKVHQLRAGMCETPLAGETIPLERGSVLGDLLSLKVPYYAHFNVDTIVWGVYSKLFKKNNSFLKLSIAIAPLSRTTFAFHIYLIA